MDEGPAGGAPSPRYQFNFLGLLAAKITKEALDPDRSLQKARMKAHRDEQVAKREARLLELATAPEKLSATCRNHRLRQGRRDAWWQARYLTDYWRARLDWHSALSVAQTHDVAEDCHSFPKCDDGPSDWDLLALWRAALMSQVLTPAPDVAAVNWKRAQLRGGQHKYTDVKPERIERAIAADVEWLNAHPSRKKADG